MNLTNLFFPDPFLQILTCPDRELNQWVSVKKMSQYRCVCLTLLSQLSKLAGQYLCYCRALTIPCLYLYIGLDIVESFRRKVSVVSGLAKYKNYRTLLSAVVYFYENI